MFRFSPKVILFYLDLWLILSYFLMCYKVGLRPHSFAWVYLLVPAPFIENNIVSPLNCFGSLVHCQFADNRSVISVTMVLENGLGSFINIYVNIYIDINIILYR